MKVIVFGVEDTAELAHYYLTHDSDYKVIGFTVHEKYLKESTFKGLPVLEFENLKKHYKPGDVKLFAPMMATSMNKSREKVYNEIKSMGFEMISYVSSKATVCDNQIGDNCFILEDNTLQPFTRIGNNVVMWSGNHIGHHGVIRDHVFFTSHVVLSGHCDVGSYSFFGVNSTIRDYSKIGEGSLISMGANVLGDTEPWGVYVGNPAKKTSKPSFEVYK